MSICVALDAMGGDHAPAATVEGAIIALRQKPNLKVLLVGHADVIHQELTQYDIAGLNIEVVDAAETITMEDSPSVALKTKPQSSMHIAAALHKMGKAHAFVSAGNTGATMAVAIYGLGRLEGVMRPTVVGYYPTIKGHSIVVDVGTNVDCKPEQLLQFAHMGAIFTEKILNTPHPTVALMNVGTEKGKGNEQTKLAFDLLEKSKLNFIGNMEGRDLLNHVADVVVCDGFVGNIMLKLGESIATGLKTMIATEMQKLQLAPEEQQLVGKVMHQVQKRFDYEEYGGAPLLGVNGTVMIGHGGSSAKAISNLVLSGAKVAEQNVNQAIQETLNR